MKKILCGLILFIIIIFIYARYINTNGFKIIDNTIKIENLPKELNGFKIIQLSDVLLGSTTNLNELEDIVNSVNKLNPEIIVFTGDLIAKDKKLTNKEVETLKEILKNLNCKLYKYAIIGDNDQSNIQLYKEIINDSGFTLLDDKSTYIFYKSKTPIKLTGITNSNNIEKALYLEENYETIYNIALTHYPDNIENISNYDVDLILAGHSLQGQIKIPFIGGIIKKDGAQTYIGDYYKINKTEMYISGGIGTDNNFNFRFNNKPQINVYRLTSKNK